MPVHVTDAFELFVKYFWYGVVQVQSRRAYITIRMYIDKGLNIG